MWEESRTTTRLGSPWIASLTGYELLQSLPLPSLVPPLLLPLMAVWSAWTLAPDRHSASFRSTRFMFNGVCLVSYSVEAFRIPP